MTGQQSPNPNSNPSVAVPIPLPASVLPEMREARLLPGNAQAEDSSCVNKTKHAARIGSATAAVVLAGAGLVSPVAAGVAIGVSCIFWLKSAIDSGSNRPPILVEFGHWFWLKSATPI